MVQGEEDDSVENFGSFVVVVCGVAEDATLRLWVVEDPVLED